MAKSKEISNTAKLAQFLSDTMVLYIKTLNYHWNMTGPQFFMFHKLLEEQYKDLAEASDLIAERIRQLGAKSPASMEEFLRLKSLAEGKSSKNQNEMVRELADDHKTLVQKCKNLIEQFEDSNDQGTADMLIDRMRIHDKHAWLLASHLEKK